MQSAGSILFLSEFFSPSYEKKNCLQYMTYNYNNILLLCYNKTKPFNKQKESRGLMTRIAQKRWGALFPGVAGCRILMKWETWLSKLLSSLLLLYAGLIMTTRRDISVEFSISGNSFENYGKSIQNLHFFFLIHV